MSNSNQILQQGDWILKDLTLTNHEGRSINVVDHFVSLEYSEDIFNNITHGKLKMKDGIDLIQYFPIIGEEELSFSYTTSETYDNVEKKFFIYKIGDKKTLTNDMISYTLYFVSREAFADQNISVSQSFKNKQVSDIVRELFKYLSTDSVVNIDKTINLQSIIIPNWSPLQGINWCSSIAKSANYNGSLFLFYENSNGFNFRHIEDIINTNTEIKLSQKLAGQDPTTNENIEAIWPALSIVDYRIIKTTDKLDSLSDGMFGSRTISYDNVTKNIRISDYDYNKEFENQTNMSRFKLVSSTFPYVNPTQRVMGVPTKSFRSESSYVLRAGNTDTSQKFEEINAQRTSMLSQLTANQIEIEMYGDSRITSGMMVDVELQNRTSIVGKKERIGDRFFNEKMLIGKCKHKFTTGGYEIVSLLYKDSMSESPIFDLGNEG